MPAETTDAPLPHFSRRLTELREGRGLSRYALARRCGLTLQALINLERGAVPSFPTAQRVAAALDVPLADLAEPENNSEKSV